MPNNPFRLRLLDLLEALPHAMPLPVAVQRSHTREALGGLEHLAVELNLQTHRFCLVHSTVPELQATAILECAIGPVPEAHDSTVYRRLLEFNFREATRQSCSLSIDASRGHIVLSTPMSLSEATAEDLVALMLSNLRTLRHWQATGPAPTPEQQADAPTNTTWCSADSTRV